MEGTQPGRDDAAVRVVNGAGTSSIVLVCEHAAHAIPADYDGLGLAEADRLSHAAWDPGALAVAEALSARLGAVLIAGTVSRLVHDLNRPPATPEAMPARTEAIAVPGNADLGEAERRDRADRWYHPFRDTLATRIAATPDPIIVTIHSFTPLWHGERRDTEIGVLHDSDSRLADAMLESPARPEGLTIWRNSPYGPEDGVTHTLREHALPHGYANVMLEVRNDLIATSAQQGEMAALLAPWLTAAVSSVTREASEWSA